MPKTQMVLEFVRVFLGWPAVVLFLGFYFLKRFKAQIAGALDRIASIRLPGGSELLMPQQAARNVLAATTEASVEPALPEPGDSADAAARIKTERERAYLWEYRYLNYFLVPKTQIVLDWLVSRQPMGIGTYDTWLMQYVPNAEERLAVLGALQTHHLVDVQDDLITVTPKGREYVRWRGPASEFLRARFGARPSDFPPPPPPEPLAPPTPAAAPESPQLPANAP